MSIKLIAFTDRGEALGNGLAEKLGGELTRCNQPTPLHEWVKENFKTDNDLIFIGATGIAVRSIAPYVKAKTMDPAVVCVDEKACHAISLLSGHIGGANDLTRKVAELTGADPVITTATDVNREFAVDEWARKQGLIIKNPRCIKDFSSKLLQEGEASIATDFAVSGKAPENVKVIAEDTEEISGAEKPEGAGSGAKDSETIASCDGKPDAVISWRKDLTKLSSEGTLVLIPKVIHIGIGCRKDIPEDKIISCYKEFLDVTGIDELAVAAFSSIDIKSGERGLLEFSEDAERDITFYTSDELNSIKGDFTPSEFVKETTGVDNVCERSAALSAEKALMEKAGDNAFDGEQSPEIELLARKYSKDGVTMAAAIMPFGLSWPEEK